MVSSPQGTKLFQDMWQQWRILNSNKRPNTTSAQQPAKKVRFSDIQELKDEYKAVFGVVAKGKNASDPVWLKDRIGKGKKNLGMGRDVWDGIRS
eukprot:SAG22_NODE_1442_length_4412_cov_48.662416_3_plen_94_part_00